MSPSSDQSPALGTPSTNSEKPGIDAHDVTIEAQSNVVSKEPLQPELKYGPSSTTITDQS